MSTIASLKPDKVQLSVRIEDHVMRLLDAEVARARLAGQKTTKERLASDAIIAAYSDHDHPTRPHGWLPEHQPRCSWTSTRAQARPCSTSKTTLRSAHDRPGRERAVRRLAYSLNMLLVVLVGPRRHT